MRSKFNSPVYDDNIFNGVYGVVATNTSNMSNTNYTIGSSYNSATDIGPRPVKKYLFSRKTNSNAGSGSGSSNPDNTNENPDKRKNCIIM